MGTIDKNTADKIIKGIDFVDETKYIILYQNMFNGDDAYGAVGWREDPLRYHSSPACRNPKLIWKHPKAEDFPKI